MRQDKYKNLSIKFLEKGLKSSTLITNVEVPEGVDYESLRYGQLIKFTDDGYQVVNKEDMLQGTSAYIVEGTSIMENSYGPVSNYGKELKFAIQKVYLAKVIFNFGKLYKEVIIPNL